MESNEQRVCAVSPTEPVQTIVQVDSTYHAPGTGDQQEPACFLASVMVPRAASTREIATLETAMQGLALDAAHPVALELAGTATSRQFLLRATSLMALRHLQDQMQARYPQAKIQPVAIADDPLILRAGERVAVTELRAGAAAYLPLRAWGERDLLQEGADPLLGILAVFNHLPQGVRVVTQLALVPAAPTWSQAYRRKSVEHPLEQERLRARRELSSIQGTGPTTLQLVGMGVLVAFLLLWLRFKRQLDALVPSWLAQAAISLLHGTSPRLTSAHLLAVEIGGVVACLLFFCLAFIVLQVRSRMSNQPLYDMRLVAEKTARPAYRTRLRLYVFAPAAQDTQANPLRALANVSRGVSAQSLTWAHLRDVLRNWRETVRRRRQEQQGQQDVLTHLIAAYRQYHTAAGGYFVPHRLSSGAATHLVRHQRKRVFVREHDWDAGLRHSAHFLSVADMAALWHLPQAQDVADVPYLERGRARTLLAPVELTLGDGWKIGTSSHAGHALPVYLPQECLRHNLLAVASTGKGKSTLFQHLAQAVFAARASDPTCALAFIEPHGDVVSALCGLVPSTARDNVVLVDLANTAYPVGINPLDMVGKDRDKIVDTLITIAEHLWVASYGSRTENVLEYTLKTLADANEWMVTMDAQQGPDRQYTLLDVVPLLSVAGFRHAVMEQVHDPLLTDWWQHYYEPLDAHQQREITSSVITKMSKFASARIARRILGQPRSTIDLREVIRTGQILLVNTASGVVGSDLSELVGIVLLGLFEAALAEQARLPQEKRRRYLVLIDEFQVYRGANYQAMLAELRKYGGSFGLATQSLAYLDRLDRTLRATVLANIDHLFAFHMAGEDARLLHELDGIAEEEITHLDDFQCYVKLSLAGHRLPVFSLALDGPPQPDEEGAKQVQLRSQQRDGRPAGTVDDLIRQSRARHHLPFPARRTPARRATVEANGEGGTSAPASSRRHKKRGSSGRIAQADAPATSHLHLMYGDEDGGEANREGAEHDGSEHEA